MASPTTRMLQNCAEFAQHLKPIRRKHRCPPRYARGRWNKLSVSCTACLHRGSSRFRAGAACRHLFCCGRLTAVALLNLSFIERSAFFCYGNVNIFLHLFFINIGQTGMNDPYFAMIAFAFVVDKNSVKAGAKALGLTENKASELVANLEEHLGKQLLIRRARSFDLTAEGQKIYQAAREMLEIGT